MILTLRSHLRLETPEESEALQPSTENQYGRELENNLLNFVRSKKATSESNPSAEAANMPRPYMITVLWEDFAVKCGQSDYIQASVTPRFSPQLIFVDLQAGDTLDLVIFLLTRHHGLELPYATRLWFYDKERRNQYGALFVGGSLRSREYLFVPSSKEDPWGSGPRFGLKRSFKARAKAKFRSMLARAFYVICLYSFDSWIKAEFRFQCAFCFNLDRIDSPAVRQTSRGQAWTRALRRKSSSKVNEEVYAGGRCTRKTFFVF